jgi:regulatory protein RepA
VNKNMPPDSNKLTEQLGFVAGKETAVSEISPISKQSIFEAMSLKRINIKHRSRNEPAAIDYVIEGSLPTGIVANLSAPGGTGKSFFGIELAYGVASDAANQALLRLPIRNHGKVVILNAEDPEIILEHRVFALGKFLSDEALDEVDANVILSPLAGLGAHIMDSQWQTAIIKLATGARLIIVDTHSRWTAGLKENDNGEQAQAIETYGMIARLTGATVLFMHHSTKESTKAETISGQSSSRGAASITDNCRWQGYMQSMTKTDAEAYHIKQEERFRYVAFGGSKENYGQKTLVQWYERKEGGVLISAGLTNRLPVKIGKIARGSHVATAMEQFNKERAID